MDLQQYWKNKLTQVEPITDIHHLPLYGFQFFFQNMGPFQLSFITLTLVNILSAASGFGSILIISHLLSHITSIGVHQIFFFYLPLFLLLKIISELLDFITRKFSEAFPVLYADHLLLRFYKTVLNSSFTKILSYSKEKLNGLIHLYTSNVSGFLNDWVWGLPRQFTLLLIIIVILFVQNPLILLINLIYFSIFLLISFKNSNRISSLAQKLANHGALWNSVTQSFFFNLNSVKRLNIANFFETNYKKYTQLKWDNIKEIRNFHAYRWFVQLNLFNLIFLSTLFYGVYQVAINKLPLGFLILINWAYANLWNILVYLIEYYAQLVQQKENTKAARIEFAQILNLETRTKAFPSDWNSISFENVFASFLNNQQKHLKIKIPRLLITPGDHLGIIGKSGSGKSTILNMILGIVDYQGHLTINRFPLKEIKITRSNICLINNDDPLFNIPILDNISLGENIAEDKIKKILDGLQISSFINDIHVRIGDIGTHFSSGQLQRLRLARGLLQNASLYLFDEPFNGIDKENKSKIITFMKKILADKTIILVTHNPSELKLVDKIYRFKGHQLVSD